MYGIKLGYLEWVLTNHSIFVPTTITKTYITFNRFEIIITYIVDIL